MHVIYHLLDKPRRWCQRYCKQCPVSILFSEFGGESRCKEVYIAGDAGHWAVAGRKTNTRISCIDIANPKFLEGSMGRYRSAESRGDGEGSLEAHGMLKKEKLDSKIPPREPLIYSQKSPSDPERTNVLS